MDSINEKREIPPMNETEDNELREEFDLQFHWYFLAFFIIYIGSFLPVGILIMGYLYFILIPRFLDVESFLSLFTTLEPLIIALTLPIFLMICYLLHLVLVTYITRWLWGITEKKCPSKEGIIPRNIPSKTLNYYHIRSFMIKYGKNAFVKGPFPFFLNWFYNTVGSNIIGKGTTIEEEVTGDKFVEIGKNCYIGADSNMATHLVEGIFGRVNYFKAKVGDNCTFTGGGGITPGCEVKDNSYFLPYASAFKHSKFQGDNYYFGMPPRKFFKKNIIEYLGITEEQFKKEKELRDKQISKAKLEED